jgi:hypothetical protein
MDIFQVRDMRITRRKDRKVFKYLVDAFSPDKSPI